MKVLSSYLFDLEKNMLKFHDKETKIYIVKNIKTTIKKYLLIGINKGLVIVDYDQTVKPKINHLSLVEQKNNYIFNSIENGYVLMEYRFKKPVPKHYIESGLWHGSVAENSDYLLFNDAIFVKNSKMISENVLSKCCFEAKAISSTYYQKVRILYSPMSDIDYVLVATVDYPNNIYTVYQMASNYDKQGNVNYSVKQLKTSNCAEFIWCPFDLMFAVTKYNMSNEKLGSKVTSNNTSNANSFTLVVYKISKGSTVEAVYTLEDCTCNRIFTGNFIGVFIKHDKSDKPESNNTNSVNSVVENNENINIQGVELNFPGTFSKFTTFKSNQCLVFYSWLKKERKNFIITEEPLDIVSSNDSRFMVVIYKKKYVVYGLNSVSGNTFSDVDPESKLQIIINSKENSSSDNLNLNNVSSDNNNDNPANLLNSEISLSPFIVVHEEVLDAIIYEDFILFFITNNGVYFHILNHKSNYPIKLLKPSQSYIKCNLKIDKFSNLNSDKKSIKLNPTSPPCKILSVSKGKLILAYSNSMVKIEEIDHILLKAVYFIKERDVKSLREKVVSLVDKKYVNSLICILCHYFSVDEEVFRRIFSSRNQISHFELHHYVDCFLMDFSQYCSLPQEQIMSSKLIRAKLCEYLVENNIEGLFALFNLTTSTGL